MMITIISTSVTGKRKKERLFKRFWYGGRWLMWQFEVGQKVKTNEVCSREIGRGRKGKIVGFNRPNNEGLRDQVLKVLLEGESQPRNLSTNEVMRDYSD